MTQKAIERQQAVERLREMLKPGDTVYTTILKTPHQDMGLRLTPEFFYMKFVYVCV